MSSFVEEEGFIKIAVVIIAVVVVAVVDTRLLTVDSGHCQSRERA